MAREPRPPVALTSPPPFPTDSALPTAGDVLGPAGAAALRQFLAARRWDAESIEPLETLYRPQRSLAVSFRAEARRGGGRRRRFTLAAEVRPPGAAGPEAGPGPATGTGLDPDLPDPIEVIGPFLVWAFPYDPALPGLGGAADPSTVRDSLFPPGAGVDVTVDPIRYRPRRRAVLRYRFIGRPGRDPVVFAKVLPPARAAEALAAARSFGGGGHWDHDNDTAKDARQGGALRLALPRSAPGPGVVLTDRLPGRSLRQLLVDGDRLPAPARVAAVHADLARAAVGGGRVRASTRGRISPPALDAADDLLRRLVPSCAGVVTRVVDAAREGLDDDSVAAAPVHGDLYDSQILVDDDFRLGLIDLDDVGLGDPLVDAANLSAHLLVYALSAPRAAAGRLLAYRALLRPAFLDRLGAPPRSLAWREAFAVLLLAAGPFRRLHPSWPAEVQARAELAARLLHEPD